MGGNNANHRASRLLELEDYKMQLSYEYNEYVIGYVVTDDETGRSCNFQFDHDRNISYDPVGQRHFVTFGCEGDDTHADFSEEELNEMRDWLRSHEDVKKAEKIFTSAHETYEIHEEFRDLCARSNHGVYINQVEDLVKQA